MQYFTINDLKELDAVLDEKLTLDGKTLLIKTHEVLSFFPKMADELKRLWAEEERLKWLDPEMCHGEDNEGRCFLCHNEEGQECASCIAHAE